MTAIKFDSKISGVDYSIASLFYEKEEFSLSENHLKRAISTDPNDIFALFALRVCQESNIDKNHQGKNGKLSRKLISKPLEKPLMTFRNVEEELIARIYEIEAKDLNHTPDARYGNGRCSVDFNLFKDHTSIIKDVSNDLIKLIEQEIGGESYIADSFFNILGAGGGTVPHNHVMDRDEEFRLERYKYSLVYYLSVGEQTCEEPGTLRLYDPECELLPSTGMILIFPASRSHSSSYSGASDRIMIGINFYIYT